MNQDIFKKLVKDLPKDAIVSRGKSTDLVTGKEKTFVGYKWQYYVEHLNKATDGNWNFNIISKDYDVTKETNEIYCIIHAQLDIFDNEMTASKQQIGFATRVYTTTNDINICIKSAVDDAFARCCAFFGVGMKAYKGEENRVSFDKTDKERLIEYITKNKMDVNELQKRLIHNGFEGEYATSDEDFDEDHKLLDIENVTEEQAKEITDFIGKVRAAHFIKPICEKFEYEAKAIDYQMVHKLLADFGADVLIEGVNKFVTYDESNEKIASTRKNVVEKNAVAKWSYIRKICDSVMADKGKENKDKKKVVENTVNKNILGKGGDAAIRNQSGY